MNELLDEIKAKFKGMEQQLESQRKMIDSLKAEKLKAVQEAQRADIALNELNGKMKKAQKFFSEI